MDTDTSRMKAILVLAAAIAFAAAPFFVPFDGFDPSQYPVPQDDPPVQPAGYAFSIWGPIYLWLLASAGFGLVQRADSAAWDRTRWPLFLSLAPGAAWLSVAQISPVWATVLIWFMLATALVALLRAPSDDKASLAWPVGLYAGWLTAASAVSLGLLSAGYGFAGPVTAAWVAIAIAALVAAGVVRWTANPAYALAVIWALIAVVVRNLGGPGGVTFAAGFAAVALALLLATSRGRPGAPH